MMRILRALYAADVRLDPSSPPVAAASSSHDMYDSMPVVLTRR